MKHVICPYCHISIPVERYKDGKDIIPEFLTCDVCGKEMELVKHTGEALESLWHKMAEKINTYDDTEPE